MSTQLYNNLQLLCSAYGCANQASVATVAMDLLHPFVDETYADALGNIIAFRRANNPSAKTILLEAHMDEIGFLVTHIDDAGFVHVAPAGGVDARIMAAQSVVVFGDKPYNGIVSSVPPHLSTGDKALPTIEEMGIDIGLPADIARQCIPLGSRIAFSSNFTQMHSHLVCSKSLDNRSGMAAIIHTLQQLTTRDVNVAVAFCVQEELGCRGASVATRQIQPDEAIIIDVSFAVAHGENPMRCGKLGGGVMIGISPILHEEMTNKLFSIAAKNNIPYQTEVMASSTGTDADPISVTDRGVPSALLSIPLRYMHTPNEIIDINDIIAVSDLLKCYIEGGIDK